MPADIELELPENLYERLEIKAAWAGLSLSDYLLRLMTEMVEQPFLKTVSELPKGETDSG